MLVVGEKGEAISGIDVTPANVADGEHLGPILDNLDKKGRRPEIILGDTAYSNPATKENQVNKGTTIEAKVSPSSNVNGYFSKDDFVINLENRSITCPAENTENISPKILKNHKGGTVNFDARTCNECPLKDQYTKGKGGRNVRIHPYEKERQAEKSYQQTLEFKELYAYRSHVERIIAHLKQGSAGFARYFGLKKTTQQIYFHALFHNIKFFMKTKKTGELCLN